MPRKASTEETFVPSVPADKLAVEIWAERKGMLPQFFPGQEATVASTAVEQVEARAVPVRLGTLRPPSANPEYWKFAAAKAGSNWTVGFEVTEAEFDEAVRVATVGHVFR